VLVVSGEVRDVVLDLLGGRVGGDRCEEQRDGGDEQGQAGCAGVVHGLGSAPVSVVGATYRPATSIRDSGRSS
jgi:hypothetical protein